MQEIIETKILKLNENEWLRYLELFEDASVYQTNAFAKYSKGGKNIEHFIMKLGDDVVAASLVRIIEIPLLKRGIAYIRWAPLFQKKGKEIDLEIFDLTIKKLVEEYVIKRKFILRIYCGKFLEDGHNFSEIFIQMGFSKFKENEKTLVLDISQSEDTIKANFRKKWRYSLNKSERTNLKIVHSSSDEDFDIFLSIYKAMHSRKQFKEFVDVDSFKLINAKLPSEYKMEIFICYYNSQPISAVVISSMGNSGIYLLGGTNDEGLKYSASYLLQWEVIKWLKAKNIKWYNLGGIDPINGPGVYTFKTGMGGKAVTYLGGFELSKDMFNNIILKIIKLIKH